MIKSAIAAAVISISVFAPVIAHAQSDAGITRAQVKAELVELVRAGYQPDSDRNAYPEHLLAAEQRVAAIHAAQAEAYANDAQRPEASQNVGVTRAQVNAELVALERVGYQPEHDRAHYPDGIQAAESRLVAQGAQSQTYAVAQVPNLSAAQIRELYRNH